MRHRLLLVPTLVSLGWLVLAVTGQTSEQSKGLSLPTPVPVTVEQMDRLEIQAALDQVLLAQKELQNVLLRKQVKYRVPVGWNFNFETASFEPPRELAKPPVQEGGKKP